MSTPTPSSDEWLQFQLKKLDNTISHQRAQVEKYKKAAANKSISASAVKAFKSLQDKAQKALDATAKTRTTTQNNYYKATGQYDKLLSGTDRDAYAAVTALFKSYGLESLAGKVYDYVKNGYSPDTVSILLQDTKEYKERFAGNELRKKQGLPVLSAGEYLATEASYRQIMSSAGLPPGFYDQNSDFNSWIGGNVSPSEIQSRVDLATRATVLANPDYKKALNQMGIADSELTAYFLDQNKSLPYIQKAAATAQIGAQALANNLAFDQTYAGTLATKGITAEQAGQGYQQIAQEAGTVSDLASIYGTTYSQREAEQATFEGNTGAINKRKGLASRERGQFSGGVGTGASGLSGRGGAK